jgi:hypothetical protein
MSDETAATGQPEETLLEADYAAARLRAWFDASGPLEMDEEDLDQVKAVLEAYCNIRANQPQLRPEYGLRTTFIGGSVCEEALGTNPEYVRERIAQIEAEGRADVLEREPLQRKVSGWKRWPGA